MARKQKNRPSQKTKDITQKSFRLYNDQDGILIAWLAEFAKRYKQTDLIRLALYTLSGLDMPPELAELLPPQHAPQQLPLPEPDTSASEQIEQLFVELDVQRREASEQIEVLYQELADEKRRAGQQLEAMIAELSALREDVRQRQPVRLEGSERHPAITDRRRRSQPAPRQWQPLPETPPDRTETPELSVSSGIDLSGGPPPTMPRRAPEMPPTLPEAEPDFDPEASARLLIQSIKGFGKDRR